MDELTRLREENEELKRRLKDKVTFQSLCLAECYERDLERWREWAKKLADALEQIPKGDEDA